MPTQAERLFRDMCEAAIELQALAQRLQKCEGLSKQTRSQAEYVAQSGRTVALACVALNRGQNPAELRLFYGQWLAQRASGKVASSALSEEGVDSDTLTRSLAADAKSDRMRGKPQPHMTREALAARRAKLYQNTATAVVSQADTQSACSP